MNVMGRVTGEAAWSLSRPIQGLLAMHCEGGVHARETFAIDEFVERQGRRMSRFDDRMLLWIDQLLFGMSETAPEKENKT